MRAPPRGRRSTWILRTWAAQVSTAVYSSRAAAPRDAGSSHSPCGGTAPAVCSSRPKRRALRSTHKLQPPPVSAVEGKQGHALCCPAAAVQRVDRALLPAIRARGVASVRKGFRCARAQVWETTTASLTSGMGIRSATVGPCGVEQASSVSSEQDFSRSASQVRSRHGAVHVVCGATWDNEASSANSIARRRDVALDGSSRCSSTGPAADCTKVDPTRDALAELLRR